MKNSVEGFLGDKLNFAEYIRIKILVAFTIMKSGLNPEQETLMDYEQLSDIINEIDPTVNLKVITHNKIKSFNCCTGCFSTSVPMVDLQMIPFKYSN